MRAAWLLLRLYIDPPLYTPRVYTGIVAHHLLLRAAPSASLLSVSPLFDHERRKPLYPVVAGGRLRSPTLEDGGSYWVRVAVADQASMDALLDALRVGVEASVDGVKLEAVLASWRPLRPPLEKLEPGDVVSVWLVPTKPRPPWQSRWYRMTPTPLTLLYDPLLSVHGHRRALHLATLAEAYLTPTPRTWARLRLVQVPEGAGAPRPTVAGVYRLVVADDADEHVLRELREMLNILAALGAGGQRRLGYGAAKVKKTRLNSRGRSEARSHPAATPAG